jgi:hypothetical protein
VVARAGHRGVRLGAQDASPFSCAEVEGERNGGGKEN